MMTRQIGIKVTQTGLTALTMVLLVSGTTTAQPKPHPRSQKIVPPTRTFLQMPKCYLVAGLLFADHRMVFTDLSGKALVTYPNSGATLIQIPHSQLTIQEKEQRFQAPGDLLFRDTQRRDDLQNAPVTGGQ